MTVRIGVSPLGWTNDDLPSLGAEIALETCLKEGKEAGFSGFELGNKFPRQADVLGPVLASHQLSLVSGWYSGRLLERTVAEEIDAIQDHMNLLKALGANVIVFCDVTGAVHGDQSQSLLNRPVMSDEEWVEWGHKLTEVAEYTRSQGMSIAYHHHMGTVVQTEDDVDKLMSHTGEAVGLLLDGGHMLYAGGDSLAVAKRYAHRIKHVHCKDIRADVLRDALNRNLSFLDAVLDGVFTVPGDGCINYSEIFLVLKQVEYKGWLVIEAEQDPAVAHPLTYATLGANTLKELCREAELELAL